MNYEIVKSEMMMLIERERADVTDTDIAMS
jgi:hypothetical protein